MSKDECVFKMWCLKSKIMYGFVWCMREFLDFIKFKEFGEDCLKILEYIGIDDEGGYEEVEVEIFDGDIIMVCYYDNFNICLYYVFFYKIKNCFMVKEVGFLLEGYYCELLYYVEYVRIRVKVIGNKF